jgi:oxygen-independent coproporphyrinogen-3 oxidase
MSHEVLEILEHEKKHDDTEAGNYFVANYPPFSYWDADTARTVRGLLHGRQAWRLARRLFSRAVLPEALPLLLLRVYTDKNMDEIKRYLDAGIAELELYARSR